VLSELLGAKCSRELSSVIDARLWLNAPCAYDGELREAHLEYLYCGYWNDELASPSANKGELL